MTEGWEFVKQREEWSVTSRFLDIHKNIWLVTELVYNYTGKLWYLAWTLLEKV
jgi:hypothetical protein